MDAKLKRKWVKALLSGRYKQDTGGLLMAGGYCCLGVLGKCAGLSKNLLHGSSYLEDDTNVKGAPHIDIQTKLARINDLGIPFDMIAGLIDEAL